MRNFWSTWKYIPISWMMKTDGRIDLNWEKDSDIVYIRLSLANCAFNVLLNFSQKNTIYVSLVHIWRINQVISG